MVDHIPTIIQGMERWRGERDVVEQIEQGIIVRTGIATMARVNPEPLSPLFDVTQSMDFSN